MDKSYLQFVEEIEKIIENYKLESLSDYNEIRDKIDIIKAKIEDETLYLGAVGAFSSGKSTFINSMIHKYLLPTDAVQGTTVSATILKKSEYDDLEIYYTDGSMLSFNHHEEILAEKYGFEYDKHKPNIFERFVAWLKKLLKIATATNNSKDKIRQELFLELISKEEKAKDIEKVVLEVKNENIPFNIGLVDTPGIESLNSRHNEVTQNAIEKICDAIVVIIPYDEPVSMELIKYIKTNIGEYIDNCIFAVTKVELLEDVDELPRLMKVIKKRLEQGLEVTNPFVVAMPTLLYLKSVDPECKITLTLLDRIPEETKQEFGHLYEDNLQAIQELLETKREDYVKKKLLSVCEQISDMLIADLNQKVAYHEQQEKELRKKEVLDINTLVSQIREELEKDKGTYVSVSNSISIRVANEYTKFEETLENVVGSENSLDETEKAINNVQSNEALERIERASKDIIQEIVKLENERFEKIGKKFTDTYKECGEITTNIRYVPQFQHNRLDEYVTNRKEQFLQKRDSQSEYIQTQTRGIVNAFKSLFSKNIQKIKESVISAFVQYLEEECLETVNIINLWSSDIANQAVGHEYNYLQGLVQKNRKMIETYCNENTLNIERNQQDKMRTEQDIKRIKDYIEKVEG